MSTPVTSSDAAQERPPPENAGREDLTEHGADFSPAYQVQHVDYEAQAEIDIVIMQTLEQTGW